MPEIGRIQSTNFQSLLTDLGITRNNIPFALRSEVTPVVLVGGTVSFIAAPTPPYAVADIFTNGPLVAPVAATLLADTGPLPAGVYSVRLWMSIGETNILSFDWRNAANSANLFGVEFHLGRTVEQGLTSADLRFDVANDNERFRISVFVNAGVGIRYQATIFAKI